MAGTVASLNLDGYDRVLPAWFALSSTSIGGRRGTLNAGRPSALRAVLDQLGRKAGIAMTVVMDVDSLSIQKQVISDGGVYGLLSRHAMAHELRSGALQAARIVGPSIEQTIVLAATTHHPLTLAARKVAELLRQLTRGPADKMSWTERPRRVSDAPCQKP